MCFKTVLRRHTKSTKWTCIGHVQKMVETKLQQPNFNPLYFWTLVHVHSLLAKNDPSFTPFFGVHILPGANAFLSPSCWCSYWRLQSLDESFELGDHRKGIGKTWDTEAISWHKFGVFKGWNMKFNASTCGNVKWVCAKIWEKLILV